jgi:hypothetical protein
MFVSGDLLVPRLHGDPHWAKPPLVNWLGVGFMTILGVTTEAARLPSALGGCVMILAIAAFAARIRGPRAAVLAAWMAASTLHVAVLGRAVTTDMLHAGFTVAALVTLHAAVTRPDGALRNTFLAGIFLGIAFLAKGPVGLGVTLVTLLGFALLSKSFRAAALHRFGLALLVALAIGLPWYLLAAAKHPPLVDHWLGRRSPRPLFVDRPGADEALVVPHDDVDRRSPSVDSDRRMGRLARDEASRHPRIPLAPRMVRRRVLPVSVLEVATLDLPPSDHGRLGGVDRARNRRVDRRAARRGPSAAARMGGSSRR